ncbi:heat shock chaperone IbpB [Edwardsiella ictaluri]|uniref:small heat shock chaperone IbpB n=1 Tax=Edwardsiella ictaluri TaxID=67780 RepID=UPI0009BCE212|nr:small heat shock chaperone IbpB [Edwardsiella ictaluri]ARD39875.1 molecular chaperone [Edwardsiella ictaluri]QPW25419.1 heat shock chaperone IbpB [Edwardsiella ictaluri]
MRNYDLAPLMRQWIGFDKLANAMQTSLEPQGFPPYNIEKSDDNHYRISLALAGFRQSELDLEVEGPRLTVRGNPVKPEKPVEYLHQGLVCKAFELSFTLAEHLTVEGAAFENGLLNIDLVRHVPEVLQPQRIVISAAPRDPAALECRNEPDTHQQ